MIGDQMNYELSLPKCVCMLVCLYVCVCVCILDIMTKYTEYKNM